MRWRRSTLLSGRTLFCCPILAVAEPTAGLDNGGRQLLQLRKVLRRNAGSRRPAACALPRIVSQLQGQKLNRGGARYPGLLPDLDSVLFERLGRRYLEETQVYRRGRPRFVDKMPNNFSHIALIHLMLPTARIIDIRREPMACCLSNLKQLYARGRNSAT